MTTTTPGGVTPVTNENGAEILVVSPAHLGEFIDQVNREAAEHEAAGPEHTKWCAGPSAHRSPEGPRPLATIALEIRKDWARPYFDAVPYIEALGRLDKITDQYGCDSAESIVRYFLVNARTWKGDVARRVEAELRELLGDDRKREVSR